MSTTIGNEGPIYWISDSEGNTTYYFDVMNINLAQAQEIFNGARVYVVYHRNDITRIQTFNDPYTIKGALEYVQGLGLSVEM